MNIANLSKARLHWREDGNPSGKPVVFANSLGTDLRLWDKIIPLLPQSLRLIRFDKRGHGLSSCPPAPYSMDDLICDAEDLMDHLGLTGVVFIGLSIGGLIGQGLATKRPDLIKALVLSNTAAKMGDAAMWQQRIGMVQDGALSEMAGPILERWFSPPFHRTDELEAWRNMLTRVPQEGYWGCCAAIADTDLTSNLPDITQPTLGIAGALDGASSPELVRATIDRLPNAHFETIAGVGHLPCVEAPQTYADLLIPFFEEINHV
ncbi:3-oxoadipate enol-lactonase [Cohaesibacter celericrescens]|uniref:3-oxoadipate enol-lactonase n=1 Tax=Cohaesibacter celericrescens TaxID=2067669 RepID=A0A2N5XTX8_9HYPH|nr:3-oxoadipate enol-lactonase [Cohaesibacter celericrescens]PLW77972.1 3-oxoadipate enol-lactonase [Cohaesibacter celericrescens]